MSTDQYEQRILALSDYQAILDLWRRAGLTSIRPHGRDSYEAFARQFASGVQHIIGLLHDSRLVGAIVATHDGRKGWLNRLAIDPRYRRQGLGRLLIAAAEEWLSSQGLDIWAVLIEEDSQPSLELFQSQGYVLGRDILYLSKRLDPTS
jgi:GNAT superfamily N-acetyltransferase